jgi:hypothetical protein
LSDSFFSSSRVSLQGGNGDKISKFVQHYAIFHSLHFSLPASGALQTTEGGRPEKSRRLPLEPGHQLVLKLFSFQSV